MKYNRNVNAYADCEEIFQRALSNPAGVKIKLDSIQVCQQLRTRLHYYRTLDRKTNQKTYPEDHPLHGNSAFDILSVSIQRGENEPCLLVKQAGWHNLVIEDVLPEGASEAEGGFVEIEDTF